MSDSLQDVSLTPKPKPERPATTAPHQPTGKVEPPISPEQNRLTEDMLDEASMESFPASDPPAWISRHP